MSLKTPGELIEEIAAAKGLGQGSELARRLGVAYETLRGWRTGRIAPNRRRQSVIADVLGVPPDAFMQGTSVVASADGPEKLSGDERRLLVAFRLLLAEERARLIADVEKRAAELRELMARLQSLAAPTPAPPAGDFSFKLPRPPRPQKQLERRNVLGQPKRKAGGTSR